MKTMKNIKKFEHFNLPEETNVYSSEEENTYSDEYDVNNPSDIEDTEHEEEKYPEELYSEDPEFAAYSEAKKEKWVQKIKMKKGALHKQLGYGADEKIPAGIINKIASKEIGSKVKVKGENKTVTTLLKQRAGLAKRLKSFNEHQTTNNYMFFANLQTMKRYIDAIMNLSQEEVDEILSEHDWASDHISVACENLEHVHNFLLNHEVPSHDHEDDEDDNEFDAEYEEEYDEHEDDEHENEFESEPEESDELWQDEEVEENENL